jgi:hypothetical protein
LTGALNGTTASFAVSVGNSNTGLDLTNNGALGYGNSINFYQNATKVAQIFCESSAANTSEILFKTTVASTLATRLIINSAGNVGIGTASPANKLFVVASGTPTTNGNNSGVFISHLTTGATTDGVGIGSTGASTYKWIQSYDGNLCLNPAGNNVGIGTATPITRLSLGDYVGARLPYINGTTNTFSANGITVSSSNSGSAAIGGGLDLTNNTYSAGAYSPVISFSSLSINSAYNNSYAGIWGILGGPGGDNNWVVGSLAFGTASSYGISERMRIIPSGNVLIGTTTDSGYKLQVNGNISISGNNYLDFGNGDSRIVNTSGQLSFQTYTIGSFDTRMTITGPGNVGIGTASPGAKLDILGTSGNISSDMNNRNLINLDGGSITSTNFGVGIAFLRTASQMAYIKAARENASDEAAYLAFATQTGAGAHPERMRITSAGFLKASNTGSYVNSTGVYHEFNNSLNDNETIGIRHTGSAPYGIIISYTGASPNNTSKWFAYFQDSTALRFEVRSNGGIANYAANDVNLSDERTKKDIIPLESYWDKFKAIEIVKFKYKDQTHDDFNIGVIAQQVEAVAPEFVDVDGWDTKPKLDEEGNEIVSEEEPLKAIYTADLHHATIKVLQEAMAKIEKLETEIDSLKNK